jgi:hypothetical protein
MSYIFLSSWVIFLFKPADFYFSLLLVWFICALQIPATWSRWQMWQGGWSIWHDQVEQLVSCCTTGRWMTSLCRLQRRRYRAHVCARWHHCVIWFLCTYLFITQWYLEYYCPISCWDDICGLEVRDLLVDSCTIFSQWPLHGSNVLCFITYLDEDLVH